MSITENLTKIKNNLPKNVTLVVVTKNRTREQIMAAYQAGHKIFGENKVQELISKQQTLLNDIEWHFIGHLQRNKVKQIVHFVKLIQSVDSLKLLKEINKQANRVIDCLLQVKIAQEESKFGLSLAETKELLTKAEQMKNINIVGLMGIATHTDDQNLIQKEFQKLAQFFQQQKSIHNLTTLSLGMSNDYQIAIEEGSTMVRVGSAVFNDALL